MTTTETLVGAKVLNKQKIEYVMFSFVSATFSDGENNTHTYSSRIELGMLQNDFPNDCYLVSMEVSDVFNFDFLNQAYDMQILQFPININGQSFSDGMTAFDYIMQNNITNVNFGGDIEVISYFDGDDYQVTSVSGLINSSGFKNYQNRIILLSNLTSIGYYTFYECSSLTSIEIPNSVISIGEYAFCSCHSLTSIEIPSKVTSIGDFAFSSCSSLTSIEIPSGVTSISSYVFNFCNALTSITFGENSKLASIGNNAFQYCRSLSSITIPNSVTSIGSNAFKGCSSLTTMRVEATTPPTLQNTDAISTATTKIYIPAGTLSAYQSATNWSNFASLFEELPS